MFLNELTELSKKYGIYIGGSGCCDSPYLYEEEIMEKYDKGISSETAGLCNGEFGWSRKEGRYIFGEVYYY